MAQKAQGGLPHSVIEITLTQDELETARKYGKIRQSRADLDGRKDTHGFAGDPLGTHIFGIACEIAGHNALGLTWKDTPYRKGERDLPKGLEIRGRRKHYYDLLIWPTDDRERAYIHVTNEIGSSVYRIHGMMLADEAMQDKYWKKVTDRPASYFVPAADLIPIEDLLKVLKEIDIRT